MLLLYFLVVVATFGDKVQHGRRRGGGDRGGTGREYSQAQCGQVLLVEAGEYFTISVVVVVVVIAPLGTAAVVANAVPLLP